MPAAPTAIRRILIVEDERPLRSALRVKLARNGFEVTEAADGKEGVALMREHRYDLVLLDLLMPGMDGITALRELRDKGHKGSPIVIITNLAENDPKVQQAFELGAVGLVIKAEKSIGRIVEEIKDGRIGSRPAGPSSASDLVIQ